MGYKLVLVGGGGHCKSVLDTVLSLHKYDEIVITDGAAKAGDTILGIPVVGDDSYLPELFDKGFTDAFITVGSVGNTFVRRKIYANLKKIGFNIPNIIDKTAVVSESAVLGEGNFVGKNAVISVLARVGNNCIINTAAVVDHECKVGDFVRVSAVGVLCGGVTVGDDTHIGAGTTVRHQITIGKNSLIGIGSTVVKDIPDGVVAYGNPCEVRK